ncbi:5'-nucleotidase C-terminal domain-containing protein [uncultured Oscillibacter sp.]|uniref:5'-nucleotidase C-terminal domain-containing protein n=1 Tax=uncultured Oscillibacter sp. TaxID=876091 RepID=UPI0025F7AFD0|nr:5'-nucleotidase C-terminal domain-containing protein [uncultured Oscillibacter sp.]
MRKTARKQILALLLAAAMLAGLSVPALAAEEGEKTVTILQTSDLHGMVNPFDYASNKENKTSLAHAAAIIKAEREADPDLLLLDTGDTTQANYIQSFLDEEPDPMIHALNYLGYDAWTLGNHEFNFDFKYTQKKIDEFEGTVLGGNFYKDDGTRWIDAYHIFDVDGVKVAVFGVDAPHIPQWEKSDPGHYDNMKISEPMEEIGKILDELEGQADVIVGSVHYGLDGEYGCAGMREVAEAYGERMDALFIGHAHAKVDETIGGIPVLEPGSNGEFVGKVTLTLKADGDGWTVDSAEGGLLECAAATPDPDFLKEFQGLHEKSLELASREVGTVGETFIDPIEVLPGIPSAVLEDDAVTDLVNKVQMLNAGADVSLAALFDATSNLQAGPFLHRDSVKIYKYDNTLYGVKVTGKQMKAIMEEKAGSFFNQYQPGDVTISFDPNIRLYNYDMFAGLDYEIDISKPVGSRIQNVVYKGHPMTDDETMILALNNYRYGGLVSAGLINESDVVYEGGAVRDMITEYVESLDGPLMPEVDNNWKIVGADLDDPQKDLIYEKVRSGEIQIPTSEDGRTPNIASLNGPALRAAGLLPALEEETPEPAPAPEPEPAPAPEPEPAPAPEPEPAPAPEPEPAPAPEPEPAPVPAAAEGTYTVKSGDCLWSIAQAAYGTGTKWGVIYAANQSSVKDPASIQIGQVLTIPAA